MDPLSLTASIIAIVGAGGQAAGAVRKLAGLKGAPDLILALNNELNDLHLVVSAIQDIYHKQRISSSSSTVATGNVDLSVTHTLQSARQTASELEALYHRLEMLPSSSSGSVKFNKIAWLKEQKHVRQIQQDLRDARIRLAGAIGILNSYV